jgi:putative lipoprotein (rSAM/lipoprotein system)
MKVRFLKLKSWLLMTVMGALGLSGCHSHKQLAEPEEVQPRVKERQEIRLMYGVPTMNYRISGKVHDAQGKPVKDVRVNMLEHGIEATADTVYGDPENVKNYLESTSVRTDKKGRFVIEQSTTPREEVRILVRDVDGASNGAYKNQLIHMEVDEASIDKSNAGGWNRGDFNKEIDIKLERK